MITDIDFVREALNNNPLVWDFVTDELKTELDNMVGDKVVVSICDYEEER